MQNKKSYINCKKREINNNKMIFMEILHVSLNQINYKYIIKTIILIHYNIFPIHLHNNYYNKFSRYKINKDLNKIMI